MDSTVAKQYLEGLKKQIRQREVYEAIDIAIEALAWKIAEEKVTAEIKLIKSFEQQQ